MSGRKLLRRIHVWLGWLVGVPLLFWTASGLWMAARPIVEVRGTALRAGPVALALPSDLAAPRDPRPIVALLYEAQGSRTVAVARFADGGTARFDPTSGNPLPGPDDAEARRIAIAALAAPAAIVSLARTPAAAPPLDLRRDRPAWGVRFADDAIVYVDAEAGSVLALRTEQWRWFDWMWGLHIMDLKGRANTSHAILIVFAAVAAVATLLAIVLLPMTGRRRRAR